METRLVEHDHAEAFWERARPFLEATEAEHNLIIGITGTLRTVPHLYRRGAWLATLEEGDRVVGASLQTPPHDLLVTAMPEAAAEVLARTRADVTGVNGPTAVVERLVASWARPHRVHMRLRIYRCSAVEPLPTPAPPGRMRLATAADAVVLDWRGAFSEEVGEGVPTDDARARYRAAVDEGSVWIWEADDARPAAMAATLGPTPTGIRVGAVYTPPDRRRRGYASHLVAQATSHQLATGRRFCFLYTDLANPTSNAIYQRIGYRPVCDILHVRLGAA